MVVHNVENNVVKPLEFGQWLCRKPSAGLIWAASSGVQCLCRCSCRIYSEADTSSSCIAMTQHYPTTSAAAAVWSRGISLPVYVVLLIYTYSLLRTREEHQVKRCRMSALQFYCGSSFNLYELTSINFVQLCPPGYSPFQWGYVPPPGWPRPRAVIASVLCRPNCSSCTIPCHGSSRPSPPLANIRVMVIVWRLRGNIIRTAPCWVV